MSIEPDCPAVDHGRFGSTGDDVEEGPAIVARLRQGQGDQARGVRAAAPDLLVHHPGHMDENHAAMEVKPPRAAIRGIRKDLLTLSQFRMYAGYERAICLFYGHYPGDVVHRLVQELDACPPIEVWLHADVGEPAEQVDALKRWSQLIGEWRRMRQPGAK